MADKKRWRVVGKDYIMFPNGVRVDRGQLVPVSVKVEQWLIQSGWVEEK